MPAAGYEIDFLQVRGIDRAQPAEGGAAARARGRRAVGRRAAALRAARRPTSSWAAAATSPAPPGSRPLSLRAAAGADRGRQPPRARQPPARPPGAARLPRLPDRRAGRGSATWSRAGPVPAAVAARPTAPRRGGASGSPPRIAACSSSAAARAPARSTSARSTPSPATDRRPGTATSTCSTSPASRDYQLRPSSARPRRRAPSATRCSSTSRTSATPSPPATWCSPARAARSSRWRPPGGRRSSSPTRTRRRDHQNANAAWMADAGAAVVIEDAELDAAALARTVGELLRATPGACGTMSAASASLARPDAAERIADERSVEAAAAMTRLAGPQAALHRDRRRRDERAGAGLPTGSAPR